MSIPQEKVNFLLEEYIFYGNKDKIYEIALDLNPNNPIKGIIDSGLNFKKVWHALQWLYRMDSLDFTKQDLVNSIYQEIQYKPLLKEMLENKLNLKTQVYIPKILKSRKHITPFDINIMLGKSIV